MSTQRSQKNLTVMFTDISGFTKHTETISREALMSRLDTHNELLMPVIAHFEGKIVKTIGDAFLITFESPTNAVQCGLFMQHTLRKYNAEKPEPEQIHIKVSINSGEVTVTENDVFGDPVNVAAKIEKATNPDEIYFTEAVFLAMNKAEVPTSFVKAFRPKGAESTEIKLYKVAMDEGDERYQKVIRSTHIDKEKMKTRVLELSNVAEKEFTRYQDTLDALVESQSSSSRTIVIAVIVAALILAGALIAGFAIFGGSKDKPDEQLARDVRAYLTSNKPDEARGRIETYINEFGADDTTTTLLNEIRDHEVLKVVAEADRLIEQGQPENARSKIKEYFGAGDLTAPARQAMGRVEAYLQARDLIKDGKAKETNDLLATAFGDTNPSSEIKRLREQADALNAAAALMRSEERFAEPMRMYGAITGAFGEDTTNQTALQYIEEALANELYRDAKSNGYDVANANYEAYRKRVTNLASWAWVNTHMKMGAMWQLLTDPKNRSGRDNRNYWELRGDVADYVKNKPEKLYRFGCMEFMLARVLWQSVCDGADSWLAAVSVDPSLSARHSDLMSCYRVTLNSERSELGRDLKTDVKYLLGCFTGGLIQMRDLVKKLFYNDLRETMVSYFGGMDPELETERMNALAILSEMGDAALIPDRFAVFREQFDTFITSGGRLERYHSKALFEAEMSYDDYKEFRRLIDSTIEDVNNKTGKFSSYTRAREVLQGMLEDLRLAQPQHTAQYDGG
ncbi:MAG: adenylate/guanylate cyclase domain-containing protein [Planctomycetes bacterium]|nr:adenylate/guanylate cyclase domain-containing protein [Planctomycetota bacterium]MCB9935709.1 adenylate/guanylate cyclase domain-containing protein [Planctomycetota bacterium]